MLLNYSQEPILSCSSGCNIKILYIVIGIVDTNYDSVEMIRKIKKYIIYYSEQVFIYLAFGEVDLSPIRSINDVHGKE